MKNQSGNAFIYILIAIVLFAALSFTMTRMQDQEDTSEIETANLTFRVNEIMTYRSQVKKIIQQMVMSGTQISDIDFVQRGEAGYDTAPHYNKIFHIGGGGLIKKAMNDNIKNEVTTPAAGWYLDRFNNVEWTPSSNNDVLLVAYQIKKDICAAINKKLTGSETIPTLGVNPSNILLNTTTNNNFTVADCPACEGKTALCVASNDGSYWVFYDIVAAE